MSLNDSIPFVITQFHCTGLGLKHISAVESETDSVESDLQDDEIEVLKLIDEYQNSAEETDLNIEQKHKVAIKFAELYETVNLTRLVVLGLLKYKPTTMRSKEKNSADTTEGETAENINQSSSPYTLRDLDIQLPVFSDDEEMEIDLLDETNLWSSLNSQTVETIDGDISNDEDISEEKTISIMDVITSMKKSSEQSDDVDPMLQLAAGLK